MTWGCFGVPKFVSYFSDGSGCVSLMAPCCASEVAWLLQAEDSEATVSLASAFAKGQTLAVLEQCLDAQKKTG